MMKLQVRRARRRAAPFDALRRDHEKAARAALALSAAAVRDEARATLSEVDLDRPSPAGAPPRRRSGRLRDSVFARVDRNTLSAEIGTDLHYGAYLEFGTETMAPRPWLTLAFDIAKPTVRRLITDAVRPSFAKRLKARAGE